MSTETEHPSAQIWYTIWPENGAPQSFGPFEMKATYYPHPEDDEKSSAEAERQSG